LGDVTPYFLKRRESYKFIYLNKYLIIAFHPNAYFPLCCEVFLYFTVQVEVIKIQISLQIIRRFEKRKGFSNSYLAMGRNQLEAKPGLASRSFSPPNFLFLRGPTPAQQHHSCRGPAAMIRATPEQSS
jgi:hypothetical protein